MGVLSFLLILLLEIVSAADTCARDAVARECAGEEGAGSAVDEALEQYKREGWAVMKGVIDPALMEEVRDHVEYLLAKYPDIPGEHFHHMVMRNDPFWVRLITDPRLTSLARIFADFIDTDLALFSSHYFIKQARTGKAVAWHQDGAYWPLEPMHVLTLWLAVDQVDRGNGCLRLVRGSHTWHLAQLAETARNGSDVLGSTTHTDQDIMEDDVVDVEMEPGDVEIHHPNIVHSSLPNMSDRRRAGLTIRYMPPTTHCLSQSQPVLMVEGEKVPGINQYRSWPKYRPGYDFPFTGADTWNEKRRIESWDEPFFKREDYEAIDKEIVEECLQFVDDLGGR